MSQQLSEHYISDILKGFEQAFEQNAPLFIENAPFHDYSHPEGQGLFKRTMEEMMDEAIDRLSFSYGMGNVDLKRKDHSLGIQTRKKMGVLSIDVDQLATLNQDTVDQFSTCERGLIIINLERHGWPAFLNHLLPFMERRCRTHYRDGEDQTIVFPPHVQMCALMNGHDLKRSLTALKNRGVVVQNHHRPNMDDAPVSFATNHGLDGSEPVLRVDNAYASMDIDEKNYRQVQNAGSGWLNRLLTTRQQKGLDDPTQPDRPLFKQS